MTLQERQLKIEQDAHDYSYNRMINQISERINSNSAHELQEGKLILILAIDKVAEKIEKELFTTSFRGSKKEAVDFIASYEKKTKDLAYLILSTIVQTISKDMYITTTSLSNKIIGKIQQDLSLKLFKKEKGLLDAYVDRVYKNRSIAFKIRQKKRLSNKFSELDEFKLTTETLHLGTLLIDCVIKSGVNIIQQKVIYDKNKKSSIITYTEECFKMILQSRETLLASFKKYPIFISPPKQWETFRDSAGYYTKHLYSLNAIKSRHFKKLDEFFSKKQESLSNILNILNILQQTKWKINERVYETIKHIIDNNIVDYSSNRNNPYLIGKLPYNNSQEPEDYIDIRNYGELQQDNYGKYVPIDKTMYKKYNQDIERQRGIILSTMGKALALRIALVDAEEYLYEPNIYFSYQFDYRSRIYTVQQHLHPQGNGVMKALLHFSDGCKIENQEQLDWFMIHGANCYGYDKEEYEVRIAKIKEKHEEILAIAKSPMEQQAYWKDADEPFLYLAWCFEYADYHANPDTFISHLPIGLDATCSGIQIYSGLLRDELGAKAVNVTNRYIEVEVEDNYTLKEGEKWVD